MGKYSSLFYGEDRRQRSRVDYCIDVLATLITPLAGEGGELDYQDTGSA